MAIPIQCPACGARLKAAEALAGKKVRCKACRASIDVPAGPAASSLKSRLALMRPRALPNPLAIVQKKLAGISAERAAAKEAAEAERMVAEEAERVRLAKIEGAKQVLAEARAHDVEKVVEGAAGCAGCLWTLLRIAVGVPCVLILILIAAAYFRRPAAPGPSYSPVVSAPVSYAPPPPALPARSPPAERAAVPVAAPSQSRALPRAVDQFLRGDDKIWVEGYTRKDGTHVKGYWRRK